MTIEEIKEYINTSERYSFLRDYSSKIVFITLSGSYSYGTNTDDSDIDLRGVFLSDKNNILLGNNLKKTRNDCGTDTTLYSLEQFLCLCAKGNIAAIELLFTRPECFLYVPDIGMELLKNRDMFFSTLIYGSIGGYVESCLTNLQSKFTNTKTMILDQGIIRIQKKRLYKSMVTAYRLLRQGVHLYKEGTLLNFTDEELAIMKCIRNGELCQNKNSYCIHGSNTYIIEPTEEYIELISESFKEFDFAKSSIVLKGWDDKPDWNRINEFLINVNEKIVKEAI